MKSLYILVMMQLKEQLNLKRYKSNLKFFNIMLASLGEILKFVLIVVLCGAFLIVYKSLLSLNGSVAPLSVISLVFSAMLVMSIISCTAGLTKSMYYARDNAVLLTLPCTPLQVYLSKLIIFFIFEVKRSLSFVVPMFLAYFITMGYFWEGSYNSAWPYIWMLFCVLWISLFTVAIGAVLSIPAMWIGNFFRQQKWLQITALVLTVTLVVLAVFVGISLIPDNIDLVAEWSSFFWKIMNFLDVYSGYESESKPFYDNFLQLYSDVVGLFGNQFRGVFDAVGKFLAENDGVKTVIDGGLKPILQSNFKLTNMIMGSEPTGNSFTPIKYDIPQTATTFCSLLAVTLTILGMGLLIVRPLFYKMASTPFEYLKKSVKPKKNRAKTKVFSSVYTNFLITVKNTNTIFANVGVLISVPMLIFLLNKIFLAMKTREMGDNMIIAFNLLIILLVVLNSNCSIASLFSRDGQSSYLIKTLPSKYTLPVVAKLLPNTTFGALAILATAPVLLTTLPLTIVDVVHIILAIEFIFIAHMFYSAQLDLMNPQRRLYASVGSTVSNPNETKSTVSAFLISFLTAVAIFLLLFEGEGHVYSKLIFVALGALIYRTWMFFSMLKLYYKEK